MTPNPTLRARPGGGLEAEVAAAVRGFLAAYHPDGRRGLAAIGERQNLWRQISSLTLLQLVAFVEQRFEIQVKPIDFAPQNFASIAAISRFVGERHRASCGSAR
jgi:hypothetical protein